MTDDEIARLHNAIQTYQCPGCALAADCSSVEDQSLNNGCTRHCFSQLSFGEPHGVVLGVALSGPGWVSPALPVPFNVFPAHARTVPLLAQPPGESTTEATALLCHLDVHGNTLVRWYVAGKPRHGVTTVHLGDARAALPGVPELTQEHLEVLKRGLWPTHGGGVEGRPTDRARR